MCLFHKYGNWETITKVDYSLYSWFNENKCVARKTEENQKKVCVVCNGEKYRTIHYHRD